MRRQGDDERSVAVLALGRQRAEVVDDGRSCATSQVRELSVAWHQGVAR